MKKIKMFIVVAIAALVCSQNIKAEFMTICRTAKDNKCKYENVVKQETETSEKRHTRYACWGDGEKCCNSDGVKEEDALLVDVLPASFTWDAIDYADMQLESGSTEGATNLNFIYNDISYVRTVEWKVEEGEEIIDICIEEVSL